MNATTLFSILFGVSFVILLFVSVKVMLQRDAARAEVEAANYQLGIKNTVIADQDQKLAAQAARIFTAETAADVMAPLIREHVRLMREAAILFEDENPPSTANELEALRLHETSLKLRPR